MDQKPLKSWRTFASESKIRRKPKLTPEQIERANKIFEEIEKEQKHLKRRVARDIEA